jgi:hypothetical protein
MSRDEMCINCVHKWEKYNLHNKKKDTRIYNYQYIWLEEYMKKAGSKKNKENNLFHIKYAQDR